ncbi:unnamed protein product [Rotaria magnacalcarata]|uniref:Uncharacterized protein n=1 Tax=Rotaria magnacalcarata TaxID=392030 RepID=A0A816KA19_9BILA|nr:unnamed protein product [Rotaria magnacalcarata]CAF1547823.1 unnamed protein product [Rotaria magnacalcarata]CAF1909711.1 unnamed protein product [Rotaria magnacalcarata]CAF3778333.1 unnamed protein product [Rotaria magnacalcarata]CAF3927030.1 unnamed protein product [Rotaria magnacalcarata]
MPKVQTTTTTSRASPVGVTTGQNEQSLGPNLQSRLEALEAAMGVRLNVAKRQGRQSLSNTASSSPMQVSPTSTSSVTSSTTTTTSLSTSSRHNILIRSGQGVQRSASSCDVENRPGPFKRLKPSLPIETSSSSTASAVATIKKYTPPVRRPITTITAPMRPIQSKQTTLIKQRTSPMDTVPVRSARTFTVNNINSNPRPSVGVSTKTSPTSPGKPTVVNTSSSLSSPSSPPPRRPRPPPSLPSSSSSSSSPPPPPISTSPPPPPPPPPRSTSLPQKQRLSIFGEQFSDDILKTNLLWIHLNELDEESRTEVLIQFGSIENFLHEQQLLCAKQQQQLKLAAKNKTVINRSRFQLLMPKKDRLELL